MVPHLILKKKKQYKTILICIHFIQFGGWFLQKHESRDPPTAIGYPQSILSYFLLLNA